MPELDPADAELALRAAGVGLVGVVLYRALSIEEGVRARRSAASAYCTSFCGFRIACASPASLSQVLEEVAMAVQASGNFSGLRDAQPGGTGTGVVDVRRLSARRRRLAAVEGLQLPWEAFAPLLNPARRVGQSTHRADQLPLRALRNQRHLVLLSSQFAEVQGSC